MLKESKNSEITSTVTAVLIFSVFYFSVKIFESESLAFANFIGTALSPFMLIGGIIIIGWIPIYYFWYLPRKAYRAYRNR